MTGRQYIFQTYVLWEPLWYQLSVYHELIVRQIRDLIKMYFVCKGS